MQDPTTRKQKQKIKLVAKTISLDTIREETKLFEEKYKCENPILAFTEGGSFREPEWDSQSGRDFHRWSMNLAILRNKK